MLDVHPPHHPVHAWRDFFLHIATIVIGLLIAIGLEQTVEGLHRHHEVVQLEEDLRAEAELNIRIIDSNLAIDVPQHAWMAQVIAAARDAQPVNGFIAITLPAGAATSAYQFSGSSMSTVPSHGVWTVAQTTGVVNLLPKQRAQVYTRLEFEAVECMHVDSLTDVEERSFHGVLRGLNLDLRPGATIRLTPQQRDEFVHAYAHLLDLQYWDDVRFALWKGASEAILHGADSVDAMFPYINKATAKVPEP